VNDRQPLNRPSPRNAARSPLPPVPPLSAKVVGQPRRCHLGPAITAAVLAFLSFVIGLGLYSSWKTTAPADRLALVPVWKTVTLPERDGPASKNNTVEERAESKAPAPNQTLARIPIPDPPRPWPPESLAFAGKKAGEEWSANGLG
jgi:hypothetical protein